MTAKDIFKEIEQLPPEEVEKAETRLKDDRFWDELREREADRIAAERGDELDSGKAKAMPVDAAFFQGLRKKLKCE